MIDLHIRNNLKIRDARNDKNGFVGIIWTVCTLWIGPLVRVVKRYSEDERENCFTKSHGRFL